MRSHLSVGGDLQFVADRDVVHQVLIHVPDADIIAALLNGRIGFNASYALFVVAKPVGALDLSPDVHLITRSRTYLNATRAGSDIEVHRAVYLQSSLERTFRSEGRSRLKAQDGRQSKVRQAE